jgi:hypothetical protein
MYDIIISRARSPLLFIAVTLLTALKGQEQHWTEQIALSMSQPWQLQLCALEHCESTTYSDPLVFFSMTLTFLGWADRVFKRYFTLMSFKVRQHTVASLTPAAQCEYKRTFWKTW